jgi:hypothetical protein
MHFPRQGFRQVWCYPFGSWLKAWIVLSKSSLRRYVCDSGAHQLAPPSWLKVALLEVVVVYLGAW